jgi:hypothetical protein
MVMRILLWAVVTGALALGLGERRACAQSPFGGPAYGRPTPAAAPDDPPRLGVCLQPAEGGGLLITQVVPDSLAEDLGLEPGFRLVTVNGRLVNRRGDVRRALAEADGHVAVVYQDQGGQFFQADGDLVPSGEELDAAGAPGPGAARAAHVRHRRLPAPGAPARRRGLPRP